MSYNPNSYSAPSKVTPDKPFPVLGIITPEMFGAVGDGVADDSLAINSAIDFCLNNGFTVLNGYNTYALSEPIDISNFSTGIQFFFNKLTAHALFPDPVNWKSATPFIRVANSGGNMVNLDITVLYMDGDNKADGILITKNGCGSSSFRIGRAVNCNIVVNFSDNTFNNSSNYFTGNYWNSNVMGAYIKPSGGQIEGAMFDVTFISHNIYGGIVINNNSQFNNVRSQLDFNGEYTTQLSVVSTSGWNIGDSVSCTATGQTGEVLAIYDFQGSSILHIIETKNTTGGNSNFAASQVITNGTVSTTISSVVTTDQSSNNIWFDVIYAYTESQPYARNTLIMPYGYVVGSGNLIGSSIFFGQNSNYSFTNSINGLEVYNNPSTTLSLAYRDISNSSFLDITSSLFAIRNRSLYVPDGAIYSTNQSANVPSGVATTVMTLPEGSSSFGSAYIICAQKPNDVTLRAVAIFQEDAGSSLGALTVLSSNALTLTVSGSDIQATQTTGSDQTIYVSALRIS